MASVGVGLRVPYLRGVGKGVAVEGQGMGGFYGAVESCASLGTVVERNGAPRERNIVDPLWTLWIRAVPYGSGGRSIWLLLGLMAGRSLIN